MSAPMSERGLRIARAVAATATVLTASALTFEAAQHPDQITQKFSTQYGNQSHDAHTGRAPLPVVLAAGALAVLAEAGIAVVAHASLSSKNHRR